MTIAPYVMFYGTCEEALAFYRSVFGGELGPISRYDSAPADADHVVPEGWENKIMHASLHAPTFTLMASDANHAPTGAVDTRVKLAVGGIDEVEGKRIFDGLSAGATIEVPWMKQFWGAHFGMLTDRFGVEWMVNTD